MTYTRGILIGVASLAFAPLALGAQALRFTAGALGSQEIVQSHVDSGFARYTGMVFGGEGNLITDRFQVRLRYAQGHVSAKSDTGTIGRDLVEGEALFGVRAMPWLTLWAGPTARAYTTADGDQRWLLWTARASARGTLMPGRMQTFLELWGGVSGSVGNPAEKAGGRGADVGLEMRLGDASQLWGRLGYHIDSNHADGLRETVEAITLAVVYGLPQ
jgi:hypothetical protein